MWRRLVLIFLPLGIPVATLWVRHRERLALSRGRPLSPTELKDAEAAGVQFPERVRVLAVSRITLFGDPTIDRRLTMLGDAFGPTIGLTIRYGILLKRDWQNDRRLLVHELVHVAQYERFGSIGRFLLCYFRECIRDGYVNSTLEREACQVAHRIYGNDQPG